jgi:hypothetical protein
MPFHFALLTPQHSQQTHCLVLPMRKLLGLEQDIQSVAGGEG